MLYESPWTRAADKIIKEEEMKQKVAEKHEEWQKEKRAMKEFQEAMAESWFQENAKKAMEGSKKSDGKKGNVKIDTKPPEVIATSSKCCAWF